MRVFRVVSLFGVDGYLLSTSTHSKNIFEIAGKPFKVFSSVFIFVVFVLLESIVSTIDATFMTNTAKSVAITVQLYPRFCVKWKIPFNWRRFLKRFITSWTRTHIFGCWGVSPLVLASLLTNACDIIAFQSRMHVFSLKLKQIPCLVNKSMTCVWKLKIKKISSIFLTVNRNLKFVSFYRYTTNMLFDYRSF